MTIGLIYPPRLRVRRSLDDTISCDPAEIHISHSDTPFHRNELRKSSSLPTRSTPHPSNKRHRRSVSFHNQVTVVEVEKVPKSESKGVWWTFGEMDKFRSEASKSKERRRVGMKRCARTSSHARKVLVQQSASEQLDGIPTDPKILSMIACDSSRKARESAYRNAKKLQEEIEKEVYSHQRSNSLTMAQVPLPVIVDNRKISDFHWGAVVDAFTDTVTCGMALREVY